MANVQSSPEFKTPPKVRSTHNDTSNVNPINKPNFGPEVKIITKAKGK
jgi:hypothetical protein